MSREGARANSEQSPTSTESASRLPSDVDAAANQGRWSALFLALLTVAIATIALVSQQLTVTHADNSVPNEGFYWAVAQYQIAHHRLKQELRAIAAGEPANAEELARRTAVLASKASILTEPSEVKTLLNSVPGYAAATHRVAELQRRIGPVLELKGFAQADAVKVLGEFNALGDDELLGRLASDVRLAEVTAKEEMLRSLTRRMAWVWAGFALCWTTLALWTFYVVRSRRRYAAAAIDRQLAVEAMEQAVDAKRKFLSMVSHELRSPLQSIVTAAESLALDLSLKGSRPQSVAAIRRIRHAVTVLQGQFRDLLTIARSNTGQLGIQVETFEFGELVRDVCAGLEDSALAKGLSFRVGVPVSPVTVSADPIRIAQVLRNLVENAVRYTSVGQVQVQVEPFVSSVSAATGAASAADLQSPAKPESTSTAGWVQFVVHDTGPGLPPLSSERLKRAALPFELNSDGTGIGLFVIRDVLQQLGGRIEVQSRDASNPEGQGTTFTVSIPATRVQDTAARASSSEPADALSVLVVDDRSDVRDALSEVTRRLCHVCRVVGTAAEAHLLLATTHFDVMLIDLEMPDKDGLALATEIRQGGGLNAASMLILISAAENQAAGQAWPFDGFLQKPIDGLTLGRLIGSRMPH